MQKKLNNNLTTFTHSRNNRIEYRPHYHSLFISHYFISSIINLTCVLIYVNAVTYIADIVIHQCRAIRNCRLYKYSVSAFSDNHEEYFRSSSAFSLTRVFHFWCKLLPHEANRAKCSVDHILKYSLFLDDLVCFDIRYLLCPVYGKWIV